MWVPLRSLRLLLIGALACSFGGCATLKKIRFPWRKKPKAASAEAPRPQFMGTIVLVNEDARFVLIDVGKAVEVKVQKAQVANTVPKGTVKTL